jgi:hypothetical protein
MYIGQKQRTELTGLVLDHGADLRSALTPGRPVALTQTRFMSQSYDGTEKSVFSEDKHL